MCMSGITFTVALADVFAGSSTLYSAYVNFMVTVTKGVNLE